MQVVYLITQNHNSLLFSARKLLCDNKKRPLRERKKCDLDSIDTKIKSAQAVTGIYYHTKFQHDSLKTVDTIMLTNKQTNKQIESITYSLPLDEEQTMKKNSA